MRIRLTRNMRHIAPSKPEEEEEEVVVVAVVITRENRDFQEEEEEDEGEAVFVIRSQMRIEDEEDAVLIRDSIT